MVWAEHQEAPSGLSDLLNYAQWAAPGIIRLKDGALLTAWHYAGPDLDLAAPEELERLSTHSNTAFLRCGSGWLLHLDLIRRPTPAGLPPGQFTDPTSALIDEERRRYQAQEGAQYESVQALALTYLPPFGAEELHGWLVKGPERARARAGLILESFTQAVQEIEDAVRLVRMGNETLLTYLHACVTGNDRLVRMPAVPTDLDTLVVDEGLTPGWRPLIGDRHLRVISVDGYPLLTAPGAQTFLHELALPYRWNTRFIFLDRREGQALIEKRQMHWENQEQSDMSKLATAVAGPSWRRNRSYPEQMAEDAREAAGEAASGTVLYGFHTMTVVVQDEDEATVEERARTVRKQVERCGYGARIERANTVEALLGSCPGHGYQNVRRTPIHTYNLADLVPLTSIWAGLKTHPSPYFPPDSPAVMLTTTGGQTPFWFTPYVHEVGHAAVLGPTRSGKSTLLETWMAQFLRYGPQTQIFAFDKGYSAFTLAQACGGDFYDIGADTTVAFAPLAHVDSEFERQWALGWLDELLFLQRVEVSAEQRAEVWHALTLMGQRPGHRTLTDLCADLQDTVLREGLAHYTLGGGAGGLLDAEEDSLRDGRFHVFEMEHLVARGEQDLIPVLLYLFHRVDQRCQAGRPTLIPIDEAWLMLLRSRFATRLDEWLRTKGRENAAVILATQSLADLVQSPQRAIMTESCQTKIFLPNAAAGTEGSRALYRALDLNDQQIERLRDMVPQREYLITQPYGSRVIDLQLGPATLAFTGARKDDIRRIRALIAAHGADWPAWWLRERGCEREAIWWRRWQHTAGHIAQEECHEQRWADIDLGNSPVDALAPGLG